MNMNIINKITVFAAAALLSVGCVPEYMEVDQTKVPQTADIEAVYEINNETNEVTFSITNKEMVPVWVVENEIVNGRKTNKEYTGNDLTLLFNERGEHTIHVKAYNAHGMSKGAKPVTFTLENYVPYDKGLKGWDPAEDSNLWRNADKSKTTFYYAPGWNQIDNPALEANGDDYVLTLPEATMEQWQAQMAFTYIGIQTTADKTYDFQVVLKSTTDLPGVTIKLTHADDDNTFYFADRHVLTANEEFLYQVVDIPGKDIPDLDLFFDFGGNPANTVVDIKQIVFSEHQENHTITKDEDSGIWDADIDANLWKTAKKDNNDFYFASTDSWVQGDNATLEMQDMDFVVTMPAVMGTIQWQAQLKFLNLGIAAAADKTYDFQFVLKADADHPGTTIKLTDSANDNSFFFADKHVLAAGKEYVYQLADVAGIEMADMSLVFDFAGAAANSTVKVTDIIICEHMEEHVVAAEDPVKNTIFEYSAPENLWLGATKDYTIYYATTDQWTVLEPFAVTADDGQFSFTLGTETIAQWQAQFAIPSTGIATTAGKTYDFQAVLNLSEDHPGVTIKFTDSTDSITYFDARHVVKAGSDYVFRAADLPGKDIADLKLVFDFGQNVAGTEVLIKDIIIQEHRAK